MQAAVIAAFGWRAAYGIVALISCALVLPWTIFVLRYQPSDRGCKPVGWTEAMGTITAGDEEARGTTLKGGVLSLSLIHIVATSLSPMRRRAMRIATRTRSSRLPESL